MNSPFRPVALCLAAIFLACWAGVTARAETWLTPVEQQFIAALGLDAKIDGKVYNRKPKYESLAGIAGQAPEPLKSRILLLADAYPKLRLSPEQIEEFQATLLVAAVEAQAQITKLTLEGLADPKLTEQEKTEKSAKAVNALLADEKGGFRTAMRKATDRYREEAEALEAVAKNMELVTAEFEKRLGRMRPASDLSVSLGAEKGGLVVTGKVGPAPLTATVMQVVVHKAKADGSWRALDQAATAMLQSMGVSNMSSLPGKAGEESKAQAAALEKAFDLPFIKTFGLPKLSPGSKFTIDLDEDLNDVIFFERVSLKAWTAEGTIAIDSVPSIEAVQKVREELPRDERFKDTASAAAAEQAAPTPGRNAGQPASQTPPTPGDPLAPSALGGSNPNPLFGGNSTGLDAKARARQKAMQEQQAVSALSLARTAIKRKQDDQARIFLNQAIALAPDSRTAETAKKLLKNLDK